MDVGPIQDWIRAFDAYDRAERRYEAAALTGNKELIAYVASDLESARRALNTTLRTLNA